MGMHHNQDIRWMGGVRKYMPITWITSLLGPAGLDRHATVLGLLPKDSIIEAGALQPPARCGFRALRLCWQACS